MILFKPTSLKCFAQKFQSVMSSSSLSLSVGCAAHPVIREITWKTWTFHLPSSAHQAYFPGYTADILTSFWPNVSHHLTIARLTHDGESVCHTCHIVGCWPGREGAGDFTSSGYPAALWAGSLPAQGGAWNGSQPGQCYSRYRKFDSSKTHARGSRSWRQALSCRLLGWMVSSNTGQIQTRQHWSLRPESDFQVVIFEQENSNNGQIG